MVHIEVQIRDGCMVCRLVGTLEADTAPRLREAMALVSSARSLVIDLSGVSFIDSAALAVLVGSIRRLREADGTVAVCSRGHVRRVLETVGFERVAAMVATVDDAQRIVTTDATPLANTG